MRIIEKPEVLIDSKILGIKVETEYALLDNKEVITGWQTLNMTES